MANPATNLNGAGIRGIPNLEDVARDVRCASGLPRAVLIALLRRNAAVQSILTAELTMTDYEEPSGMAAPAQDRMLDADQAATLLHKPRRWLFEHKRTLPFVTIVSRKALLCSEAGLKKWLATRRS
jgi:hypothetical protein